MVPDKVDWPGEIRLHRAPLLQEDDAHIIAGEAGEKSLGIGDHCAYPAMQLSWIDRHFRRQALKLFRREPAVADDLSQHLLWRRSGEPANGGTNDCAQR